jgi:alpha-L-fucosidase
MARSANQNATPRVYDPGVSPYAPTKTSLDEHVLPSWFADAKLGIFVHWGPYSVPAWAPTGVSLPELAKQGFEKAFAGNPYAEWYWNSRVS